MEERDRKQLQATISEGQTKLKEYDRLTGLIESCIDQIKTLQKEGPGNLSGRRRCEDITINRNGGPRFSVTAGLFTDHDVTQALIPLFQSKAEEYCAQRNNL